MLVACFSPYRHCRIYAPGGGGRILPPFQLLADVTYAHRRGGPSALLAVHFSRRPRLFATLLVGYTHHTGGIFVNLLLRWWSLPFIVPGRIEALLHATSGGGRNLMMVIAVAGLLLE